jgi:hypothetical protein
MITSDTVILIAPELANISAGAWAIYIAQVYDELNPTVWGSYLDEGATWFAAHLATVSRRKGVPGQITSLKVGNVSESARVPDALAHAFSTTSYGIEFMRLLMNRPAARWEIG